jgi:hypothetical protein
LLYSPFVELTEKMRLAVKKFHNCLGRTWLGVSRSVLFGTRHFFGIPRRYPKSPKEILAAARAKPPRKGIRAKNANAFFGLITIPLPYQLLNLRVWQYIFSYWINLF